MIFINIKETDDEIVAVLNDSDHNWKELCTLWYQIFVLAYCQENSPQFGPVRW